MAKKTTTTKTNSKKVVVELPLEKETKRFLKFNIAADHPDASKDELREIQEAHPHPTAYCRKGSLPEGTERIRVTVEALS
jgi:hypothetical protein